MIASNSVRWLLDDVCWFESTDCGKAKLNIDELAGNLAFHAMMLEAHLTPKPGLVDCVSQGSHRDMDINTFIASAEALRPYMKAFVRAGAANHHLSSSQLLPALRIVGIQAEEAMFEATAGVNTHKGMIFTLGLICGAVGWLHTNGSSFSAAAVQQVISQCCKTLVEDDLANSPQPADADSYRAETAGERIFKNYGMTGIRGEAAAGYPTIFNFGLPVYEQCSDKGYSEEQAMSKTLCSLMTYNSDTNLINRGGLEGLAFVQMQSNHLLTNIDFTQPECEQHMIEFDQMLIERNLSPGGSADLLAATWLLAQLNICVAGAGKP